MAEMKGDRQYQVSVRIWGNTDDTNTVGNYEFLLKLTQIYHRAQHSHTVHRPKDMSTAAPKLETAPMSSHRDEQTTRQGKRGFTVVSTRNPELILVLLCIKYCIIFHTNNSKPTFAPPRIVHMQRDLIL